MSLNNSPLQRKSGYIVFIVCLAAVIFFAPTTALATSPEDLPSPAIWTNFFQKIHEQKCQKVREQDTDADGVEDLIHYRHSEGVYIDVHLKATAGGKMVPETVILRPDLKDKAKWVYGFDTNNDGSIDMLTRGWFEENKWDQLLYDTNYDGSPDVFQYDLDQNGVYDCGGADEDADGNLDYLYDLDNKTGEVMTKTVGWVRFEATRHREALPQLYYSFEPTLKTLSGQEPSISSVRWRFGDGVTREYDRLNPAEHLYKKAGTYEVSINVEFQMPDEQKIYEAWYGVALDIEPPPPGPPPLNEKRIRAAVQPFFGACGFITANQNSTEGPITEVFPNVQLPQGAPVGTALRATAAAPEDLQLAVYRYNSSAELDVFLNNIQSDQNETALPGLSTINQSENTFQLHRKLVAAIDQNEGAYTAAFRQDAFIFVVSTNRTEKQLKRWTRLLYDIIHSAPEAGGESASQNPDTPTAQADQ